MSSINSELLNFVGERRFSTLLADPPWQFANRTGKIAPEHQRLSRYGTLKLDEIMALPIPEVVASTAHLYPWSTLSAAKRRSNEFNDLRKPGWLPTAIVVNILGKGDERSSEKVSADDLVTVEANEQTFQLKLPYQKWSKDWQPSALPPIEVIDGQHRLWSFGGSSDSSFEVPVVAFQGLDISWQAYLFWTINIKPKRINPSLAFDLYPLLRSEDWLERGEGHSVYRETRSQELATFDWRTSATPDLSDEERRNKLVFRGSSGYKEIRAQLLDHLKDQSNDVGKAAQALRKIL